ncbi:ABC transporter substrate-binding protein [Microbacterium sp.]|uniref:ABC transporter substrate-binding protein n=1 Tax=Microbacterium sp. TaxID=51671 RepID=UPI003A8F1795
MRTSKLLAAATAMAAMLALAGCAESGEAEPAAEDAPIVIGGAIGLSGLLQPFDSPTWNGVKLFVDNQNQAGGIHGRMLEIVEADTTSTPQGSRTATLEVIDKGADVTFQNCNYDFGAPGGQAASSAGIIAWSLCAGSPLWGVEGVGQTAYTRGPLTYSEGNVDARFASENFGANAYVVCDTWLDYNIQVCEGFQDAAEEYGINIIGTSNINTMQDENVAPLITDIRNTADLDFVLLAGGPPTSAAIVRQLRGAGVDIPLLLPSANYGRFWSESLPGINNVFVSASAHTWGDVEGEETGGDPRPEVNELVQQYIDTFGSNPDSTNFLEGYVGMEILAEAIEATGTTDGLELSAWIDEKGTFETVLGTVTFSPELHSDPLREFVFIEYVNAWPTFVTLLAPAGEVELHLEG